MLHRIYVNKHIVKSNERRGERQHPITIRNYLEITKASEVNILDGNGDVVAKVIYRPDQPLSCGASVWIETERQVVCGS